jgi:hypothetical protein
MSPLFGTFSHPPLWLLFVYSIHICCVRSVFIVIFFLRLLDLNFIDLPGVYVHLYLYTEIEKAVTVKA